MRRQGLFWGSVILLLGIFLLLQSMGVLNFNVWPIFWALFLIYVGAWFLFGSRFRRGHYTADTLSIPRNGAVQAQVEFHHGAGKLAIGALTGSDMLVVGSFSGGVVHSVVPGASPRVKLSADPVTKGGPPWDLPEGLRWDVKLAQGLPLDLEFHTGAGESDIDLTDLDVKSVRLETGASASRLTLPSRAQFTRVDVRARLASINIYVPQGVAARIQVKAGLAGINIDTNRFPRNGELYISPEFDSAPNRVEISAETGMGSVDIH